MPTIAMTMRSSMSVKPALLKMRGGGALNDDMSSFTKVPNRRKGMLAVRRASPFLTQSHVVWLLDGRSTRLGGRCARRVEVDGPGRCRRERALSRAADLERYGRHIVTRPALRAVAVVRNVRGGRGAVRKRDGVAAL